jgi:CRP-like cAMP-binding protein
LATSGAERLFGDGEIIVREGEPGASMFVVQHGRVVVTVGPERREVAVTDAGGYFGEMSLLTGDPRTATVSARGDCQVLEIQADAFRSYVQSRPEVLDAIAATATVRRRELDESRSARTSVTTMEPSTLVQRMRRFFGIDNYR